MQSKLTLSRSIEVVLWKEEVANAKKDSFESKINELRGVFSML